MCVVFHIAIKEGNYEYVHVLLECCVSAYVDVCVLVQRYGLSELELGASLDTSMRGPLCSLNLVAYYSYAPFMFGKLFHCLFLQKMDLAESFK